MLHDGIGEKLGAWHLPSAILIVQYYDLQVLLDWLALVI